MLFFVAGGLVLGRPARAQETPEDWRFLGWDQTATSSRCIGQPHTPLCAAETLLACFQRGKLDLCRLVDDGTNVYASVFATPADPRPVLTYRVAATRVVRAADTDKGTAAAGDVVLRIEQREALPGDPPGPAAASQFLLRQRPDGTWKVVTWEDEER
jgi:hypothetical protein